MDSGYRSLRILLPATALVIVAGCGGGGGGNGTTVTVTSNPPAVTGVTYTPSDATLARYGLYTFTAKAAIYDFGDSVSKYEWDFGEGKATVTSTTATLDHRFTTTGDLVVRVRAYSAKDKAGVWFSKNVTVDATASPIVVAVTSPAAPLSLQTQVGLSVDVPITLNITDANGTIAASGIVINPGEATATVGTPVDQGGGVWRVPVTYSAATLVGTRTVTPSVQVSDSNGAASDVVSIPAITIKTLSGTNAAPIITVTTPATPSISTYTSKPEDLVFTVTDSDGDPTSYTVNWGDGTTSSGDSGSSDTTKGVAVTLKHTFADTFTSTSKAATVTISATDGRPSGTAVPVIRTFNVTFNTYPTATITTPQESGSQNADVKAAVTSAISIAKAKDPTFDDVANAKVKVVVIPKDGKLSFAGLTTLPGSGETTLGYSWSFPNGAPSAVTDANPPQVSFSGNAGETKAYLVEFSVTDFWGRSSSKAPNADPTKFRRWVVVDGKNSQTFGLNFLYRKRSDNNSSDTFSYAQKTANGYGQNVTIYQDGLSSTYSVGSAGKAQVQIPVRSDLPFWVNIPVFSGTVDKNGYLVRIPNKPGLDPDLEQNASKLAGPLIEASGSGFAFNSAAAPWNPVLQVVTGAGFGDEMGAADVRKFLGMTSLLNNVCSTNGTVIYEPNLRWLDRLSVPTTDPLGAFGGTSGWIQSANNVGGFSGIPGYQSFAEWMVFLKSMETRDYNTLSSTHLGAFKGISTPLDMGFIIDEKYNGISQSSEHFAVSAIEALRAPSSISDPFNLDVMRTQALKLDPTGKSALNDGNMDASTGLNPTPVDGAHLAFLNNLVHAAPGGSALQGGLNNVPVSYDANTDDLTPNKSFSYDPFAHRVTFGYAEYLWSRVWARPLVINRTSMNSADTFNGLNLVFGESKVPVECGTGDSGATTIPFPYFFYSNPSNPWPRLSNVSPTDSSYDMNVANGGDFDASSPVTENGSTGTTTGVGRFFWTAFTPNYNAALGALISRTWLADANNQIPTAFTTDSKDPLTAWGFLPPQDTQVDKRARKADGTVLDGTTLGGYRVRWFNPTRSAANGNATVSEVVSPDFWVVEVAVAGQAPQHFLLPGNFPRSGQAISDQVMTDSQFFLPSAKKTFQAGDTVGAGYCWFDMPLELRPQAGSAATIRIFALRAVLKNNSVLGARALNRPEWIEAAKIVTASISTKPDGKDVSYAHKIPFNYAWDIVVVNGPATDVAP